MQLFPLTKIQCIQICCFKFVWYLLTINFKINFSLLITNKLLFVQKKKKRQKEKKK